jgi:branched-chain amino acid transport system permease protein
LGKPQAVLRPPADPPPPLKAPSWTFALVWLALLVAVPLLADRYVTILLTDIVCFALFAVSLHFIMGPAGMVSFGHAAYFGLGAYAAGLLLKRGGLPMEAALLLAPLAAGAFAVVYGWFCVRLSGVYLAMLTLAFAQISWSIVFQWDSFTGGSNGLFGVWPSAWLAGKTTYYYLALILCGAGIAFLWRVLFSPFGYALRAGRDSTLSIVRGVTLTLATLHLHWDDSDSSASISASGQIVWPAIRALVFLRKCSRCSKHFHLYRLIRFWRWLL